jgi:hypothetical protein
MVGCLYVCMHVKMVYPFFSDEVCELHCDASPTLVLYSPLLGVICH